MSQRQSHPLSLHVDWSRFTFREAFLATTTEVYKPLDPNSAERYNCHVTSYNYAFEPHGGCLPMSAVLSSRSWSGQLPSSRKSPALHTGRVCIGA